MTKILKEEFYNRDTLNIVRELLGCFLIRRFDDGRIIKAKIVETEAYIGQDDLACHASKGRTKRTDVMFGPAGRWYVYMIYGMYHCLNVVTEQEGFPAAVLIRAVDPVKSLRDHGARPIKSKDHGASFNGDGPGKLCRDLQITRALTGTKAYTRESGLWITSGNPVSESRIVALKRVGVDYAGEWKDKEWRFKTADYTD